MSTVLRGELVTLRAIRPDELEIFMRGVGRRNIPRERLLERVHRSGGLVDGMLDLGIEVDGTLIGDVQARRPQEALPPGVVEVGVDLHDSADRGRGYGREAVSLLTGHLFVEGIAERVQGSTAVDNVAMRTVFERLGFTFEGVMRGFMPVAGGREDYALYAVLREEWPAA